jgi:hypothetical protein
MRSALATLVMLAPGACLPSSLRAATRALLLALMTAPAAAGSLDSLSPAGRYALSPADCTGGEIFATLTETTLALPTYACTGVDYDQAENKGGRALYAVTAKSCAGEEGRPKPDKFSLVAEGASLRILWRDGTKSALLTRCAARGRK